MRPVTYQAQLPQARSTATVAPARRSEPRFREPSVSAISFESLSQGDAPRVTRSFIVWMAGIFVLIAFGGFTLRWPVPKDRHLLYALASREAIPADLRPRGS